MGNENNWQWFTIEFTPDIFNHHSFLPVFNSVVKQYAVYPKESITIKKDGMEYKFCFDWQDENICGIEVYRRKAE